MGGDTVLLAGDNRQTLPAISRETRANEVTSCIKYSYLWLLIIKRSLKKNMRGHLIRDSTDGWFSKLLLQIGDDKYPESDEEITLPSELGILITTLKILQKNIRRQNLNQEYMDW